MEAHDSGAGMLVRSWSFTGLATLLVCVGVGLSLPVHSAVAGSDPAVACARAKQKAAANKFSRDVKCHGTAMKRGEGVDPECLIGASRKFHGTFMKADARGGCVTTGDVDAVESLLETAIEDLFYAVPRGLCPAECADALGAVQNHSGMHYDWSRSCYFSAELQAGSVSWEGATPGWPMHVDVIRVSGLRCEVTREDLPEVAMGISAAEQAACAPLAARAVVDLVSDLDCDISP